MERARSKQGKLRVLVTGSEGFIGKLTVKQLLAQGHEVIPFDYVLNDDITDQNLKKQDYNAIIHLAAVSSTPWARANPLQTFSTNVYGAYNLLLDSLEKGIKRFVYASSARVISPTLNNPYIVSKMLQEKVVGMFSEEISAVGLRYASVYGSDGFSRKYSVNILNQITQAAIEGTTVDIFGDGSQTRDFIFADDVALANVKALDSDAEGLFDVGTGKEVSLRDAIGAVEQVTGKTVSTYYTGQYPDDYMFKQTMDYETAELRFGFRAKIDIYRGINKCQESYLKEVNL